MSAEKARAEKEMAMRAKEKLENPIVPNACVACGLPAIAVRGLVIYRFHPVSENKSGLFCKACAEKILAFTNSMIGGVK